MSLERECPDAPGQRHDPGTWTGGHSFTKSKLPYFLPLNNPFFAEKRIELHSINDIEDKFEWLPSIGFENIARFFQISIFRGYMSASEEIPQKKICRFLTGRIY